MLKKLIRLKEIKKPLKLLIPSRVFIKLSCIVRNYPGIEAVNSTFPSIITARDKHCMGHRNQLIQGMNDICDHFKLGRDQFFMFVGLGMPIRKINNRWYGHIENIDLWFKKITIGPPVEVKNGEPPPDLIQDFQEPPQK